MTKSILLAMVAVSLSVVSGFQRSNDTATDSSIVGRITDLHGCVLPGATVRIESRDKAVQKTATADSSGEIE